MKHMEEKILQEGKVLPGGILKVGSFLNHSIDTQLLRETALEIERLFAGDGVTKILTIEASGIAIAAAAGMQMGVPVVFAKKHKSSNVEGSVYSTTVHSFTHGIDYDVVMSCDCIDKNDTVLLVDDFLANGNALNGLIELVGQAGAKLAGVVVAIEKVFQGGGNKLREQGIRVEALAAIEAMSDNELVFARNL